MSFSMSTMDSLSSTDFAADFPWRQAVYLMIFGDDKILRNRYRDLHRYAHRGICHAALTSTGREV